MSLAKDLKTYKPFALNVFQRNLSYKANVIMFFIGDGMILVVTYYLWKAIYASSSSSVINGFNFNEMVVYVMMSFLTGLIINTDVSYSIMSEVKDGSIAINLIRPISYQKRILFEGLGNVLYNFVILFIIGSMGLTFFMYQVGMSLTWERVVTYFISIAMGIMLNFYYSYTFRLLSFKLTNMWGISQIMGAITQLLSGALIPLVFLPELAQGLLNYLPFSSMIYMPTMIYLGKLETEEILSALFIQLVWVVILAVIAQLVWKKLIKQLVILGGMRWMKRYARLYIKFMQRYIKSLLEYRGDFILGLVGFFFVQSVGIIFLQLVFNAIPSLSGWSFYEILFIYGFAQIPRGIDHVFTDYLLIFSQRTIVKGEFDRYLLRPLNPLFQVICERFQPDGFGEIIVGIILVVTAYNQLNLQFSFFDFLGFIFVILCSTMIYTAIKLAVASLAFWVKFAQSYLFMVYQLSSFSKYPVTIYPNAIKVILTYIVPFAFTGFYPGAYFLEKGDFFTGVVLTFIIAIVFMFFAYRIWLKGMSIYESAGN